MEEAGPREKMARVIASNRSCPNSSPTRPLVIFLVLTLAIDLLDVKYTSSACYKFPDDVRDPCLDVACQFGADCIRSKDGKKAECQCPLKCYTYGDSVGSRPVCGSDGRDYPNECELRRRACGLSKSIMAKFPGRCGELQLACPYTAYIALLRLT